jgi:hypothetical protein
MAGMTSRSTSGHRARPFPPGTLQPQPSPPPPAIGAQTMVAPPAASQLKPDGHSVSSAQTSVQKESPAETAQIIESHSSLVRQGEPTAPGGGPPTGGTQTMLPPADSQV